MSVTNKIYADAIVEIARIQQQKDLLASSVKELRDIIQERWQESGHEWSYEQQAVKRASNRLKSTKGAA